MKKLLYVNGGISGMSFKKWEELAETMRRDAVRPYYEALEKRKAGIIVKRWIDLILALGLSLVLSPVMLILALCIKLDSRGPVSLSAGTGYAIWGN